MTFRPDIVSRGLLVLIFLLLTILTVKEYVHADQKGKIDFSKQDQIFRAKLASKDTTASVNSPDSSVANTNQTKHSASNKKSPKPVKTAKIININSATIEDLMLLPGVGPKMAEKIIEFRKTKGRFSSLDQFMEIKGIGEKKFAKIKPWISL